MVIADAGRTLCAHAKSVVLTGATADAIRLAIENDAGYAESGLTVVTCPDFKGAIEQARKMAEEGDAVVLSPACASFDAFRNFEERGNAFREIVNQFE